MLTTPVSKASKGLKMYAARLEKLEIFTIYDLLYHAPFRYDNFSIISKIGEVQVGETVTIQARVTEIENIYTRNHKKIQRAVLADETGNLEIIWFNQPFLTKYIHAGDTISVSGKVDTFKGKIVVQSPEYEVILNNTTTLHTGRLVPIYP